MRNFTTAQKAQGVCLAAIVLLGFGATAHAEGEEAPLAQSETEADAPAAANAAGPGLKPSDFARISDEEETIYAVQRKAYLVERRLEVTPMLAASFTDSFVSSFGPTLNVSYHVAENLALEGFFIYLFPDESALTDEIAKRNLAPEIAKLTQMLWSGGLGVQWSPIYGKFQLFGASLGNFNFYVSAGGAVGQSRVQCIGSSSQRAGGERLDPEAGFSDLATDSDGFPLCPPFTQEQERDPLSRQYEPSRLRIMGTVAGGVRFYFSNRVGLKIEVKDYIFPVRVYRPDEDEAQILTDAVRNNIFAQVGLSFLLGGGDD